LLPGVATLAESGVPGYGATSWGALLAPAGTPPAVIALLQRESAAILQSPQVRERLATLGAEVVGSSPEQLADLMRREESRYTRMVRELQITPD
jgi:tripartite-type tricarboxylate transporter receptor subunit TctC